MSESVSESVSRYHAKPCLKCEAPFTPKGPRARFCDDCRANAQITSIAKQPTPETRAPLDPFAVIDAFALDFNIGNAVRFLLEVNDGDPLTNLQSAQFYLERAIAVRATDGA